MGIRLVSAKIKKEMKACLQNHQIFIIALVISTILLY
jgi:hypothetical protein